MYTLALIYGRVQPGENRAVADADGPQGGRSVTDKLIPCSS